MKTLSSSIMILLFIIVSFPMFAADANTPDSLVLPYVGIGIMPVYEMDTIIIMADSAFVVDKKQFADGMAAYEYIQNGIQPLLDAKDQKITILLRRIAEQERSYQLLDASYKRSIQEMEARYNEIYSELDQELEAERTVTNILVGQVKAAKDAEQKQKRKKRRWMLSNGASLGLLLLLLL